MPVDAQSTSVVADGMRIDRDLPITMDDGLVLRADVYRLALTLLGKDFERREPSGTLATVINPMRGSGPFLHDNAHDRPAAIFHNEHTVYGGGEYSSYLLLPVIPEK